MRRVTCRERYYLMDALYPVPSTYNSFSSCGLWPSPVSCPHNVLCYFVVCVSLRVPYLHHAPQGARLVSRDDLGLAHISVVFPSLRPGPLDSLVMVRV